MVTINDEEVKGRWITFREYDVMLNHFFLDGFKNKDSTALCGHGSEHAYHTNMWGYVADCGKCEEKLRELSDEAS